MIKKQKYKGRLKILIMHVTRLLPPNPGIGIYIDLSITGWRITDPKHALRRMWHKSEIDHINAEELKAIEISA